MLSKIVVSNPFWKSAFEACQEAPEARIDPYLAAPIVHGGDYDTFDRQMTVWHQNMQEHFDCELRPGLRSKEPRLTVTASWGDFVEDPTKAARLSAMECIDQITKLRN